jgi:hypothetical protein
MAPILQVLGKSQSPLELRPFTVSAVCYDGLETMIAHCMAADALAARDQIVMETFGDAIIASVFEGHLAEPDAVVFRVERSPRPEEEAASNGLKLVQADNG